jgi:hypothetical protein
MRKLFKFGFLLGLVGFVLQADALAEEPDVFKLSADKTEVVTETARLDGLWKVFEYKVEVRRDQSGRYFGTICGVPSDDSSGYMPGTKMFSDVLPVSGDKFSVQWVNHAGDGKHRISTNTEAQLVFHGDEFTISGRRAVPACQTFIPMPSITRNWRWTTDEGSPFSYTFHRMRESQ